MDDLYLYHDSFISERTHIPACAVIAAGSLPKSAHASWNTVYKELRHSPALLPVKLESEMVIAELASP